MVLRFETVDKGVIYYLKVIEQYFVVGDVSGVLNKFESACLPSANEFLSL